MLFWELDWKFVAEAMFFVGIGLLALPIGIAIACESLASRAKGRLDSERASFRNIQDEVISQEYQKLSQLLTSAINKDPDESNERDIAEFRESIRQFGKMINQYVKGLKNTSKWRTRSSILLRGVLWPGIFIFLTITLSVLARILSDSELWLPIWPQGGGQYIYIYLNHLFLILALMFIISGIYFGAKILWVTLARSE